jgi:hypothetical protein
LPCWTYIYDVSIGDRLPEDDGLIILLSDAGAGGVVEGLQQLEARVAGEEERGVAVDVAAPRLVQQLVAKDVWVALEPGGEKGDKDA